MIPGIRLNTMAMALAAVFLQGCGSSQETPGGAPSPSASTSSPIAPKAQDPSRMAITASDRIMAIGPDLRMEVGKAVGCMISERGGQVTAAMIAKAEADVRMNGRKAPPCRSRRFNLPKDPSRPVA